MKNNDLLNFTLYTKTESA